MKPPGAQEEKGFYNIAERHRGRCGEGRIERDRKQRETPGVLKAVRITHVHSAQSSF